MKFNQSVLSLGLIVMALNIVIVTATKLSDDRSQSNPFDSSLTDQQAATVRVNRQPHCGVRTFKLLMLICELKFPTVQRQGSKEQNNNHQLLNYDTFNKRSQQTSAQADDLIEDDQQSFNTKRIVDFNSLQDSISDVHVHNNPNYHRIKRSLIRDCCHRACTVKELENMC